MKCPTCKKDMRKVRWEVSNNYKVEEYYREYDKVTYECREDDVWVTIEIPITQKPKTKSK